MSTPARIDELRKKFDENPRRYFAPLANEYRKAGDLAQAVALCREFLPNQPGHMSGHIVFGQALYELGLLEESRAVFTSALTLDPENLIALRHLGDIAKVTGDAAGARRWYERVLDADPRNDDIAAQLATLATGNTPAAPTRAVPDYGIGNSTRSGAHPAFSPTPSSSPTPAYGVGSGLHGLPTPDASMRAVDFDRINERIAQSTPLHVSALDAPNAQVPAEQPAETSHTEAPLAREPLAEASAPAVEQRTFEPLDLDAMASTAEHAVAAQSPVDPIVGHDDTASPVLEGADVVTDADEDEYDADAPQRDYELVAQDSVEAVSLDATGNAGAASEGTHDDAAAVAVDAAADAGADNADIIAAAPALNDSFAQVGNAFAEIASDQIDPSEDDEWADPFAAYESSDADADADSNTDAEADEEFEHGILAPEWPDASAILASISSPRSRTPISVEVSPEAAEAFGRESHEATPHVDDALDVEHSVNDSVEHEATSESEVQSVVGDTGASMSLDDDVVQEDDAVDESSFADVFDDTAAVASGEEPAVVASDDVAVPTFQLQADDEGDADETFDDGALNPASSSVARDTHAAPSPMFVTETMGELLVSQGFVSRAVEVYDELVRRRPYDPVLTSRLAELRERLVAESIAPDNVTSGEEPRGEHNEESAESSGEAVEGVQAVSAPEQEVESVEMTSRELFAALAARRVPRRTPSRAVRALQAPEQSGLDSLFGNSSASNDDVAARALADAFAPISDEEMATGNSLDLDFGRPAAASESSASPWSSESSPAHGATSGQGQNATGNQAPTARHAQPASSGFSFDRFFPDPASPRNPTSVSSGGTESQNAPKPAAPATDDLAQFSAWLKGLGNS